MSKNYREAVYLTVLFNTRMAKGSPLFFFFTFVTRSKINVLVVLFGKMLTFGMILEAAKGKS